VGQYVPSKYVEWKVCVCEGPAGQRPHRHSPRQV